MIHIIMGLKGSGKTKKMLDELHQTVASATGDVVCIEHGKTLTYDVNYRVRLVDAKEYGINSAELLKGFLSGLHAGNFDITHVYVDNLYRTIGKPMGAGPETCDEFLAWAATFAETNNMNLTFTVSEDPANASEEMKKYL
ncbi:MAG: hypothetical protein J6J18_04805 [Oscillospiraceae bacterium]|nr:hypothetical protein [Oscillospiraceae bacterium]